MHANRKRIGTDLKKLDAHVIQPEEYGDAPEWTAEDLESADLYVGERLIRRGRPRKDRPKKPAAIRR